MTPIKLYGERKQIISEKTAKQIGRFLEKVITDGSGTRAKSDFVTAAGKTATAQTGKFIGEDEVYNAWFAGYFPAENPQYAVVIMKENGGEGALSCAPVFKEIAEKVFEDYSIPCNDGLSVVFKYENSKETTYCVETARLTDEKYIIIVSENEVVVKASCEKGAFRGANTLAKLITLCQNNA